MSLQQDILPELVEEIRTHHQQCAVVLIGSVARGDERTESDVDLNIFFPDRRDDCYASPFVDDDNRWQLRKKIERQGVRIDVAWETYKGLQRRLEGDGPAKCWPFSNSKILHDPLGMIAPCLTVSRLWFDEHPEIASRRQADYVAAKQKQIRDRGHPRSCANPSNLVVRPPATMKLRPYTPADHEAVLDLHHSGLDALGVNAGIGPWDDDLLNIEQSYPEDTALFLVGTVSGHVVAMGAVQGVDGTTAEIKRMRVATSHRRKGYGQEVLACLIEFAVQKGYSTLVLDTTSVQVPAQKLYVKNGFREMRREHGNGMENIYYQRKMDDSET